MKIKDISHSLIAAFISTLICACGGSSGSESKPVIDQNITQRYWKKVSDDYSYILSFDSEGMSTYEKLPGSDCYVSTDYIDFATSDKYDVTLVNNGFDLINEEEQLHEFRVSGDTLTISDENGEVRNTLNEVSADQICESTQEAKKLTFSVTFAELPEEIENGELNLEIMLDIHDPENAYALSVMMEPPRNSISYTVSDSKARAYMLIDTNCCTEYRSLTSEEPVSIDNNTIVIVFDTKRYPALNTITQSTPVNFSATFYGKDENVNSDGATYVELPSHSQSYDKLPDDFYTFITLGIDDIAIDEEGDFSGDGGITPFNVDIVSARFTVE